MLDRLTGYEIANHPYDLHIVVTEVSEPGPNGAWYVRISRGHGHNFKPLVSTEEQFQLRPNLEDALYVVEVTLYFAMAVYIKEGDPSMMAINDAPDRPGKRLAFRRAIEQASLPEGTLSLELVDRIIAKLREKGECLTSEPFDEPTPPKRPWWFWLWPFVRNPVGS